MQDKAPARVVLNTPSASSLNSKVGTMSYSWDRACYIMNITAPDITSPADETCEVHRGIFAGSVAGNSTLSAMVPRGTLRKLELFAYFRNSTAETCPAMPAGFGTIDRRKVVRIGTVDSFDVQSDTVNLDVTVSLPADGVSVVSQYSMPVAKCVASARSASFAGRLVASAAQSASVGGYKIRQRVSFKPEEKPMTSANGYKIQGVMKMQGP
jgi:hypothetical protein